MKKIKNILMVSLFLISYTAVSQDFTPYYFDTDYVKYQRDAKSNEVDGDFSYNISELIDPHCGYVYHYDRVLYATKDEYSSYYILEADVIMPRIVVREYNSKMVLIKDHVNEGPQTIDRDARTLKTFVRNDTVFQIMYYQDAEKEIVEFYCTAYNIYDARMIEETKIISELPYDVDTKRYYMATSENNNYFAVFTTLAANKATYMLFDNKCKLIQKKDTLIDADNYFEEYPDRFPKSFWNSNELELWMDKVKLSNEGDFSFLCYPGRVKNSTDLIRFRNYFRSIPRLEVYFDNVERKFHMNYTLNILPNNTDLKLHQIDIVTTKETYIQDIDYLFVDNDSVLFSFFYRNKEKHPHNFASLKCSVNDNEVVMKNSYHIDKYLRRQYATEDEVYSMTSASEYNVEYYRRVYNCKGVMEFNDGYLSIYNTFCPNGVYSDNMAFEMSYNLDIYLVYHSETGEILDVNKIPQRRFLLKREPEIVYSIVNGELYVVFGDTRVYRDKELQITIDNLLKEKFKTSQFIVTKVDKDFNINQYTCPVDYKDCKYLHLEKNIWFTDTEIMALSSNAMLFKQRLFKIDLGKLINEE